MTVVVVEDDDELIFDLEYNSDLFDGASMKRLLNDYEALLERLLDEPTLPLAEIQLEPASNRLSHSSDHHTINGFPVEVDRVYDALLALEPIRKCDLRVRSLNNQEVLVAYYTGTETGADRLEQLLAWNVPTSMLPTAYIYAENLDDTSGDIPDDAMPGKRDYVNDSGDRLEEQIIDHWRDILAIVDIKSNDDFFKCGGSSILALEAANWAARSFGVPITLRHFFEASNPRALADHIRALRILTAPGKQSRDHQEVRL